MKTVRSWFWLLYCTWVCVLAVRASDLVAWPWRWVLAPAWVPLLVFLAVAVTAYSFAACIEGFLRFREFWASRKRLRLWRRVQHDGLRTFLIDREETLRRRDGLDPQTGNERFYPTRLPRKNGRNLR